MKKKSLWISMLAIAAIGAFLLAGLFYMEKKDKKETSVNAFAEDAKPVEESEKKSDTEVFGQIQIETEAQEVAPTEEGTDKVSLLFTGDVLFSSHVLANYDSQGVEGVLSKTLLEEMQQADILMVNEEFPFGTTGEKAADKQYTFRVNPSYITLLQEMGTDIVSLANNHVLDFGPQALKETFAALEKGNILYTGAGDSVERAKQMQTVDAGGETYGFLAASRVIPVETWNVENSVPGVFTTYSSGAIVSAIQEAKKSCDFLTVFVHWGIERNTTPEDYQVSLAHAYIDAGADLVIGSHPHVLQGIEYYQGKPIFYSLGNFIFNQSIDKTMLVKVERENGATKVLVLPAYASGAKTQEMDDASKESLYRYLESLSEGVLITEGVISQI